ncbi:MAG: hypothetical protein CFE31_08240 [Rhizobiales bacterium PAR1]|nr:MAG: hypothetical protein CFE31_08240 [Rhizobiales bacterium PAR1]
MKRLVLLAALVASPAVAAPSFDCNKARSKAEKAICASPEVSSLDSAVADAYRLALSRLEADANAVARLKIDQKAFVTYRDKFIDNENLVLPDFLARRRDFLLSIDPTARGSVEGHWKSFWGETRIRSSNRGDLDISHWMSEPVLRSWNCGDPQETTPGRLERGALVTGSKDDGMRFERKNRLLIMSILSAPDVETGASCGFIGKNTDAMFPVMSAQPIVAEQKPIPPTSEKRLANVLPRLPAAAFDNTTDGIDETELKQLIATGASANWTLKSISTQKVVISARRPFSEVHLTRTTMDGTDLIQALTFNEKAVSYSYWAVGAASAPLTSHTPRGLRRLLNETQDGSDAIPLSDIPAPIRNYIEKTEQCLHWEGEVSDDGASARKQQIASTLKKLDCAGRQRDEKTLMVQFKDQERWLTLISRTNQFLAP